MVKKPIACNNNCGTMIYFDQERKSERGRLLPIEVEGDAIHDCPNSSYNLKKSGASAKNPKLDDIEKRLNEHEERLSRLESM